MKFALQINSSPYHASTSWTAYRFTTTLLAQQHEIYRIFFYHDGVYHAFESATPPDDENSIFKCWTELAKKYQLDLIVCISAAKRRGLTNKNITKEFKLGGLGQLLEAAIIADRFIIFG